MATGIEHSEWYVQYVNAVYWAVNTMSTIGYGDISPQTPVERGIGILFLLIASFVFAYTMNSIGAALQQISEKHEEYSKRMANINKYMRTLKLPVPL